MMKFRRPSTTTAIACAALALSVGGGSAVAATGVIHIGSKNIRNGAVTNTKLGKGAVGEQKLNASLRKQLAAHNGVGQTGPQGPQGAKGDTGAAGAPGAAGKDGSPGATGASGAAGKDGTNGSNGTNGLNPGVAVNTSGDAGWTLSGSGTGCSSKITAGALQLNGSGTDSSTVQGGCGAVHAYAAPLSTLSELTYQWWNQVDNAVEAPTIHIAVTGAAANSKFASGFANFVYLPAQSDGITTPLVGVDMTADTFASNALWYSTGGSCTGANTNGCVNSGAGSQSNPESLAALMAANPNAQITQISLDGGGSSGSTAAFQAEADGLLVGFNGNIGTRYDFGS